MEYSRLCGLIDFMTAPAHRQVPFVAKLPLPARILCLIRISMAGTFYFSTIIVINIIQVISLVIKPFSPHAFRAFNRYLADLWWGWSVIGAEKVLGVELVLTGDDVPADENALIFANHQQMPDIVAIMMLAYRKKRLGDMKWYVKNALKYVPGIGWGMQFLDCIFLKRDWLADRERVLKTFERIMDNKISIWLITFVEGTRIKPDKLANSQEYARKNGLPVTKHVLLPRTRGFIASLEGLKGHVDAIYDLTIGYEGGIPRLYHMYGGSFKRVHLDVRRFSISSLPQSEEDRSKWLLERFVRKDKILSEFFQTGKFP